MFDKNFETVASLRSGLKPSRWIWLRKQHREFHLDENDQIISNANTWTESDLESIILFDVPKESNNDNESSAINKSNSSSAKATQTTLEIQNLNDQYQLDTHDVNNNQETSTQASTMTIEESPTASDEPQPEQQIAPTRSQLKVTFPGLPICDPVDVNTVGLRCSPRLATLWRKKRHEKLLTMLAF